MEQRRLELHELLQSLDPSIAAVYFQAPTTTAMKYPCIRYTRTDYSIQHADNVVYRGKKQYTLTLIGFRAESPVPDKVMQLPLCRFDRQYVADNMIHDIFVLYY